MGSMQQGPKLGNQLGIVWTVQRPTVFDGNHVIVHHVSGSNHTIVEGEATIQPYDRRNREATAQPSDADAVETRWKPTSSPSQCKPASNARSEQRWGMDGGIGRRPRRRGSCSPTEERPSRRKQRRKTHKTASGPTASHQKWAGTRWGPGKYPRYPRPKDQEWDRNTCFNMTTKRWTPK